MPVVNAACTLVLLLLALGVGACDASPEPASADPWPLGLGESTVLGYTVVCLPTDARDDLLDRALGWRPEGLRPDAPLGLVRFDTTTFGGPLGLVVPVSDGPAFVASLARCPGVQRVGDARFSFRPSMESGLGMLFVLTSSMDARSPMDVLASLGEASSLEFQMDVRLEGGHALLVPSFEAQSVCRGFLRDVRGFADVRPGEVVLSADLDLVRVVYAESLRRAEQQLRALVTGAQLAGPLALLGRGVGLLGRDGPSHDPREPHDPRDGRGGRDEPDLPRIDWPLLGALIEMLDPGSVRAVQVHLVSAAASDPAAAPGDADDALSAMFAPGAELALRLQLTEASRLRPILDGLRPAPDVPDARLVVAADPARFAAAASSWCRPLAEYAHGRGAPAERSLSELVAMLEGWDGLLGVFGGLDDARPVLLATVRGEGLDLAAVADWAGPLVAAADLDERPDGVAIERLADGRQVVRDAQGEIVLSSGRRGPVQWFAAGDVPEPEADLLIRFAGARAIERGPVLRAEHRSARAALLHAPGETRLEVSLGGGD